tara:strand:- start:1129 stop:4764 length:3636 start_codon:yes stop_codon:yes gene_type:complete
MIPTNNGSSAPCDPISSNCVIWQGPDIPCISLCNGDTVSEVIAKLAQELCDIIDATCDCNPDLRELKLNCIPPPAQENPDLAQYLNAIIEYVCAIPTGADTIIVELPDCLHYDNSQGNPVTALPIDEYALYLANTICDILDAIAIINNQISELIERIIILENCVLPCNPGGGTGTGDPLVISKCIIPGGTPGPASVLLLALESAFCAHVALVGDNIELQGAISAQCITGTTLNLTTGQAYGAGRNWVTNANTLAASHTNQWAVICDLYSAVQDIQANCCGSGCDGVAILFTQLVNYDDIVGSAQSITFNFTASTIPLGFTDCSSSIKLTDANGNVLDTPINVVGLSTDAGGVTIQLTGLDVTAPISVQVSTCVTDGTETCQDSQSNSIPLTIPCPIGFQAQNVGDGVVFTWANTLGTSVTYDYSVSYVQTGSVVASGLINNPGSSLNVSVGNPTPGLTLELTVVISNVSGQSVTCVLGTYDVPGINCTSSVYTATSKDTTIANTDIFLGHRNFGDAKKPFWFDPLNNQIKEPPAESGTNYCKNPELLWDTTVSANGTFDITIDSRNVAAAPGNDIILEYSADFLTWTSIGTFQGAQTITVNTGITIGSIYVKARENCSSIGTLSKPTILRYDFNTNEQSIFTDDENCPYLLGSIFQPLACPAGPTVAKGTIGCDGTDYNVPGSSALTRSIWAYIGKYQAQTSEPVYYVYAAFTEIGDCTAVLMCCECPAFIMPWQLSKLTSVQIGGTTTFQVPYVIGDGTPQISVIGNPVCGTLTQSAVYNNEFTYTQNGSDVCMSDTITLEISTVIGGDCSSSQVTIPITIQGKSNTTPGGGQQDPPRGDVNVFVNTGSFTPANGPAIGDLVSEIGVQIRNACPDWGTNGEKTNLIPVTNSNWLSYGEAMVDPTRVNLNNSPEWQAVADLPAYWSGGNTPTSCFIIVLSNGSSPQYHDNNLLSGWGTFPNQQPTAGYLTDYDVHNDILTGSENSAFGKAQAFDGTAPFEDGYEIALFPITMDQQNLTASNILQQFGAYAGRLINPNEYGIVTDPDLAHFMMQGLANYMPYTDARTQAGTLVEGLRSKSVLGYFNQPGETTMADTLVAMRNKADQGNFLDNVVRAFKRGGTTCPSTPTPEPKHIKMALLNSECVKESTSITILENTKQPLTTGDIVRTELNPGKPACFEVIGSEDSGGVDQGYTIETDCAECIKSLAPPEA